MHDMSETDRRPLATGFPVEKLRCSKQDAVTANTLTQCIPFSLSTSTNNSCVSANAINTKNWQAPARILIGNIRAHMPLVRYGWEISGSQDQNWNTAGRQTDTVPQQHTRTSQYTRSSSTAMTWSHHLSCQLIERLSRPASQSRSWQLMVCES